MKLKLSAILAIVFIAACSKSNNLVPEKTTEYSNATLCTNCALSFKAVHSSDFPMQIDSLYRPYITTGNALVKGTLYGRFCSDENCEQEVALRKATCKDSEPENVMLSDYWTKECSIEQAPVGNYFFQLALFTDYAKNHGGEPAKTFSVLQTEYGKITTFNPPPSTLPIVIKNAEPQTVGDASNDGVIVLGHIVFAMPTPPTIDNPRSIWLAFGDAGSRNNLAVLTEGTNTLQLLDSPKNEDDTKADVDICGTVRGGNSIYVIGTARTGAYVYEYDAASKKQAHRKKVVIPNEGCKPNLLKCDIPKPDINTLDANLIPKPCNGVYQESNGVRRIYLASGDEEPTNSNIRLVEADVSSLSSGDVEANDKSSSLPIKSDVHSITINQNNLFLSSGTRIETYDTSTGTATEMVPTQKITGTDCDSSAANYPASIVANYKGTPTLFIGNENSIDVYDLSKKLLGSIDTSKYGRTITDFALSPDAKTLYAVPACKSNTMGTLRSATQSQKTDHHQVAILDLTSGGAVPNLIYTERDFDGDGIADGGIDLEFHNLKREMLKWCESCFGSLPPTAIRLPRIAVTDKYLYLRGNGGTQANNNSGLGQLGDVSVFDLATGEGYIFRNYVPWIDGGSGKWGLPLTDSGIAVATGRTVVW